MEPRTGLALSTDLYELTMMAGYHAAGMTAPATFELYARDLPRHRSFLVAAGLEQALEYLEGLRFTEEDIRHLRGLPAFRTVMPDFFHQYLPNFRFTGEVWAVEEGTPVFPPEPLLRVTAPMPEAQLVETALLTLVSFQTSVASRAARMVEAAAGRRVVEFGSRRAHSLDAGYYAARAAYLAGCQSTSNVEAGRRFGIPVSGTMAHSWVTAFPDEMSAFREYARTFGSNAVMLLDTYDTLAAARAVARSGLHPRGVRLDSGDLASLSRQVRAILDDASLRETTIFVSGDLDEWKIADLAAQGAPIDGFGVGAALSTSSDAPSLGAVYKLVELERSGAVVPVLKLSPGKATYPGRKQIWRSVEHGHATGDRLALTGDPPPQGARALLVRVMRDGRRTAPPPSLEDLRARCRTALEELPHEVRRLNDPVRYPVELTDALIEAAARLAKST